MTVSALSLSLFFLLSFFLSSDLAHNISVGGTNIDSNWATGFNTFSWRSDNFPSPKAMVDGFHSLGVRVIVWATSVINSDASNFAHAEKNDFLISKGHLIKWWHGRGGLLDFTYEAASAYWKELLDNVLVNETQIDGFKCDGTDPYILELDASGGAHGHDGKHISYREYADLYYGTFLNHSRTRNPYAIVWSRPVDSFANWIYLRFRCSLFALILCNDADAKMQSSLRDLFWLGRRSGSDIPR